MRTVKELTWNSALPNTKMTLEESEAYLRDMVPLTQEEQKAKLAELRQELKDMKRYYKDCKNQLAILTRQQDLHQAQLTEARKRGPPARTSRRF
jgi:chromosome segregation ATPase